MPETGPAPPESESRKLLRKGYTLFRGREGKVDMLKEMGYDVVDLGQEGIYIRQEVSEDAA